MATYKARIITSGVAANTAFAMIRASGTIRVRIRRLVIVATTPVSTLLALYRIPFASLGTPSVSTALVALQSADPNPGTTVFDTTWSVPPTLPNPITAIDGVCIAGAVGNGQILDFPEPLYITPALEGIALWNVAGIAGPLLQVTLTAEE